MRNQNYEEIKKIADRDAKKVVAEKANDQMDRYETSAITSIMGGQRVSKSMALMLLKSSWQSRAIRIRASNCDFNENVKSSCGSFCNMIKIVCVMKLKIVEILL
ncbi:MAG: hypothetical protein ACI4E1_07240 [Lachnospira sp.]